MTLVIGTIGCPPPPGYEQPGIALVPFEEARRVDGVIGWLTTAQAFVDFKGPKVWYSDEPRRHAMATRALRRVVGALREDQFLHHSQVRPDLRVPSITHYGVLQRAEQGPKKASAIAVISNYGGRAWWLRGRGLWTRNALATHENVDLYGNPEAWKHFRRRPWCRAKAPTNFKGPLPGDWRFPNQPQALSAYKAVICVENTFAPWYFTEKFVNAARAGSIPIYMAHPTVRDCILRGARWIDPADHGHDPERCIKAALAADLNFYRNANFAWLESEQAGRGEGFRVWRRVIDAVVRQINARAATNG